MTNTVGARPSTATVLFTDLVASTDLRRTLGDDRADHLRRRHDEVIRAAAAEHLGQVVKGTGDGLMIVFPAAAQGVAGAVAVHRAIDRLRRSERDASLAIRVGLSAGDVVWEDDDLYGTPVVEASRLCDVAKPNSILAAEIVRLLAGSRSPYPLEAAGTFELKGLGPLAAYEVIWEAESSDTDAPLPPALEPHETLPLAGRLADMDALITAFKQAADGQRQVALIAGEPGVGKTRLAAELSRRAHADGAVVLFGRCDEGLGVPYQPFVEAIATYASACNDEQLLEHLGQHAGELARLVPALEVRFPGLPDPMKADPETERYRLFEAVTEFLAHVATTAPVVLVVDDAHWAARPTLLMLRHIIRSHTAGGLLVLVTYRDTDLARTHPLAEILADLRREPAVSRIPLRGLDEDEVAALVASAAGHDLDDETRAFAETVHAETEGNPFFVGQVLRHLSETGALRMEDGRWRVDRTRAVGIPEGIREVIGKRLSQLSTETNEVLSVAAVIGREFDGRLLTEACGIDGDGVLDALEEAETARLIIPVSGRDDSRAFAHALVRSTLYDEIPTTRRLRIHRRVVTALEQRAARGVPCLEELAHHACESAALGDIEAAVRWSEAAAAAAYEQLAYEAAASHYQRALDVLDVDDPQQWATAAELRTKLARAIRTTGALPDARQIALRAIDEARAVGRPDILLDATLVMAGDRGWSEAGIIDYDVVALFEEGLAAMPEGDSPVRARAMARLASELYFDLTSEERRQQLSAEALAMGERLGDEDTYVFVMWCALWGAWVPGNAQMRLDRAKEIVEIGRRSGNRRNELIGHMWAISCYAEMGDGDGVRASADAEWTIAHELRLPEFIWPAYVHRACVALMDARYDDAIVAMDEGLRVGSEMGTETAFQMYGVAQLAIGRARGGLEPMIPVVQGMVEQYPRLPAWRCGLAYVYREAGMIDEAREILEFFAADDFTGIPYDANWTVGLGVLALVADLVNDVARAERLYELLLPHADFAIGAGMPAEVLGSMHTLLGLLASTMGQWDEAERRYEAGLEFNRRMGCRSWILTSNLEWARILLRRGWDGDAERVRALAEWSIAEARELDASRFLAIAEELLASAS